MRKFYLFLSLALATCTATAAVLDTVTVDGIYYQRNLDNLTAAVIRPNNTYAYSQENVTIPVSITQDGTTCDVTSIARAAFCKATCKVIQFAEGSKVTEIGQQAFQGATGIKELELPEGVKKLPLTAIQGIKRTYNMQLHKVTLPSTLDTMEVMSLHLATLDTIVCNAVMPPYCGLTTGAKSIPCLPFASNNSDTYVPKTTKVIVPAGSEKYYRAEPGWDYFDCFHAGTNDTLRADDLYYSIHNDTAVVATDISGNKYASLTSVVIPNSISKTTCTITDDKAVVTKTDMPVVELGKSAFRSNNSIQSLSFANPSNIKNIQSMAMMEMSALTGTLELPEGLKHISTSGIYSGAKGGKLPVTTLILPSTLDSLDVISIILNQLQTLEFKGTTPPNCQIRVTATQTQIPWIISPNHEFPTPADVNIVIPEGTFNTYKEQAGIGDYFTHFNTGTDTPNTRIDSDNQTNTGIYNILGVYLGTDDTNLPHGIYIINGKKVIR